MEVFIVERLPQFLQVSSLLIVFVILAIFGQRKTWISTEVIMAAALGIAYSLFPKQVLNFQVKGNVGELEEMLCRFYGVTLLCGCLTWYKTKDSLDATVPLTVMLSRLFMGSVLLMMQLFVYFSPSGSKTTGLKFSDQFVPAFVLPTALWLLGNALYLIRSTDFNTYPRHNIRLNHHLRIDAWIQLLVGAAWLSFPGQISTLMLSDKKAANRVAVHVGRCIGALFIGESITSLQASGFLHHPDKKALFINRLVTSLVQCSFSLAASFYLNTLSVHHAIAICVLTIPSLINSIVGMFTDGTTVYHVAPPSPSGEKAVDNKTL